MLARDFFYSFFLSVVVILFFIGTASFRERELNDHNVQIVFESGQRFLTRRCTRKNPIPGYVCMFKGYAKIIFLSHIWNTICHDNPNVV